MKHDCSHQIISTRRIKIPTGSLLDESTNRLEIISWSLERFLNGPVIKKKKLIMNA